MDTLSNVDILSVLRDLILSEEWERLSLRVEKRFRRQLQKIPEALSPEDLLCEAVEDLINGKRAWPGPSVKLSVCLYSIVQSKVWNIVRKAKKAELLPIETFIWESDQNEMRAVENEVLERVSAAEQFEEISPSELQEYILNGVERDLELQPIVEYWINHLNDDVTIDDIAGALNLNGNTSTFKTLCQKAESYIRECLIDLQKRKLGKQMLDCVETDPELKQILEYRLKCPDAKPREVAASLDISVKNIYNADKRLKRNRCLKTLYDRLGLSL